MTLATCKEEIARLAIEKKNKETLENSSNRLLRAAMRAMMLKIETITFRPIQASMNLSLCFHARLSSNDPVALNISFQSIS